MHGESTIEINSTGDTVIESLTVSAVFRKLRAVELVKKLSVNHRASSGGPLDPILRLFSPVRADNF
jgi:hypothetical protein